jgi:hypothetical protein
MLVSEFWGLNAGIMSALFSLYAPYHAVQVYVRGAVGEFWAAMFVPLVLLGFLLCGRGLERKRGILMGTCGIAGVVLSHTLSGYILAIAIAAYMIGYVIISGLVLKNFDKKTFTSYFVMVAFGIGISAFFWLPAFLEMRFTNVAGQIGSTANFRDHFVCLSQLWDAPWGYGGSIPGCIDGLSFKVGKLQILVAIVGLYIWFRTRKVIFSSLGWIALGMLVASVFFMTSWSLPLWERIPNFAYIQYPWRFLSYASLALAILAGIWTASKNFLLQVVVFPVIVFLLIIYNAKLFVPQFTYQRDESTYQSAQELRFRASKISDEYLPPGISIPSSAEAVVFDTITASNSATVTKVFDKAIDARYTISSPISTNIRINRAYFPGWQYWVNGVRVVPSVHKGLPEILLPAGSSTVEMKFRDTPVRTVANSISIFTIIYFCIYYGKRKKTNS